MVSGLIQLVKDKLKKKEQRSACPKIIENPVAEFDEGKSLVQESQNEY